MKAKSGTEIQMIIEAPFDGLRRVIAITELCGTCGNHIPLRDLEPCRTCFIFLCPDCLKEHDCAFVDRPESHP